MVSGGVPLYECLKAHELLKAKGVNVRVVDLFTIKPIDPAVGEHAKQSGGKVLVVEEHY